MNFKLNKLFMPALLGIAVMSCEQKEIDQFSVETGSTVQNLVPSPNLLFEELFEGTTPLSTVSKEVAADYSLHFTSGVAFNGSKSSRMELRDTDVMVNGGTRSEVAFGNATGKNRWYSFAVFFPNDYVKDSGNESITQWHSRPDIGEDWRSPSIAMIIHNDRFRFDVDYNAEPISNLMQTPNHKQYDLGVVPKGVWVEFVFHIIHSHESDGLVEIWQNGTKVLEHKGGNRWNDQQLPFWKYGIYKWLWNDNKTTDTNKRVLYYDNIRVGNENATLADLSSIATSVTAVTAPAPTPVAPAPAITSGSITREYWANITGFDVASIPVNTTPTSISELTLFEAPSNVGDNYGARIRGYITAPETGMYTFWISGDDNSELYISSSEDPNSKKNIASVIGWTNPREWNKYKSQKSGKIKLQAGQRYYIEALHKEQAQGDHVAVGWQLPSGKQERPIAGNRLSSYKTK
jgi:hypothetical protein